MSEFTKVLDRIHENLENGQPMFDGIDYLAGAQWVPALALNDTPQLYRVKPVITGMFDAADAAAIFNNVNHDLKFTDIADSINLIIESKLHTVREQAIREFIECIGAKYPNWQRDWLYDELSEMKNTPYLQGSGNPSNKPEGQLVKGPERGEPKPANEQTITVKVPHLMFEPGTPVPSDFPAPAPVMPEQRITIQTGDYVPHELITNEAVFNLVIEAFSAALDKSTFSFLNYRGWQEGKSTINKGIGITSDKEEITNISISAKRKLTLQQLFNATNGFEWPEGTDTIMDCLGRIEFVSYDPTTPTLPGVKVIATRVNSFTPEKATRRAIQPGDVLLLSDDIEVSDGLLLALREVTDKANLNLHRTSRTFYFQDQTRTMYPPSNVSIEEVFNAPNGLAWPEWATWLEISANSWCFVDDNTFHDDALLTIPRVK